MITEGDREKLRTAAIGETVTLEDGSRKRVKKAKCDCNGCFLYGHCKSEPGVRIPCFYWNRPDRETVIFVNADKA